MNVQKQEKGFTIIEVVLVLAIAALIFLMIFIALPALQRGQRDTARRSDANTVSAAINTWRGNHRGTLPNLSSGGNGSNLTEFRNNYVKQLNQYSVASVVALTGTGAANPSINQIMVRTGRSCPADGGSGAGASSSRSAQVYVRLEASNAVICADA